MIALRSASEYDAHCAISKRVRLQPRQSPDDSSMLQILIHGVSNEADLSTRGSEAHWAEVIHQRVPVGR